MSWTLVIIGLSLVIYYFIDRRRQQPLQKYPGPWLAKHTNLWRLVQSLTHSRSRPFIISQHEKYGPIVRVGPNSLSFSDPAARADIYGSKVLLKSDFYLTAAAVSKGRATPSLFSTTNIEWHKNVRGVFNKFYQVSRFRKYMEPVMRQSIPLLIEQIGRTQEDHPYIDIAKWIQLLTLDVMTGLTFGESFGFLERGGDVNSVMKDSSFYHSYNQHVGQMPWLHNLFLKNPLRCWLQRHRFLSESSNPLATFARKHLERRAAVVGHAQSTCMLDDFLEEKRRQEVDAKSTEPQASDTTSKTIDDNKILGMLMGNILAGWATTSIALTMALYFIASDKSVYERLLEEINGVSGSITDALPSIEDVRKMTYLDHCIMETLRLHPPVRFSPERVVPPASKIIAQEVIPGGTIVSVSAWVLHQNTAVFGPDVQTFNPDRWSGPEDKIRVMERNLGAFGWDEYMCIGRQLSMLEIPIALLSILRHFDVELSRPGEAPTLAPGNTVGIKELRVKLKRRL